MLVVVIALKLNPLLIFAPIVIGLVLSISADWRSGRGRPPANAPSAARRLHAAAFICLLASLGALTADMLGAAYVEGVFWVLAAASIAATFWSRRLWKRPKRP